MLKRKLLSFLGLLILFIFVGNAYGQNSNGVTASTNMPSYDPGYKVIITGMIQQIVKGNPVTIIVRNPIGNVYAVGQATLVNTMFEYDFVISDDSQNGPYTINIKYGNQTGNIQFEVTSGQRQTIPEFNSLPTFIFTLSILGTFTVFMKYKIKP